MIRCSAITMLGFLVVVPLAWPATEELELQIPGTLRVLAQAGGLRELYAWDRPEGIEYEMLKGFASLHGLKIETVVVPQLSDRLPWLLDRRGDIVAGGVVITDSRKKLVAFAAETFPIRHVAVSRRPQPPIQSLAELRSVKVGTVPGSSWAEEVEAAGVPKANLDDRYTSVEQMVQALRTGEVRAIVLSVIWAMAERKRDPQLELGAVFGPHTSVSFAVRQDQVRLLAAINQYIVATRRTPTWSRLVVKYFGEEALPVLRRSRD